MNVIISQLPSWAQGALAWVLTGSNLVTIFGLITALFRLNSIKKQNKAVGNTQITLLTTMIEKLSDTKNLAMTVQGVSDQIGKALTAMETAMNEQRVANANLALFVMECFNKSNLSDEAKADLKIMADKIFFNDNSKLIEVLKKAKAEADSATTTARNEVERLTRELELEKAKLVTAQENVKENRRV